MFETEFEKKKPDVQKNEDISSQVKELLNLNVLEKANVSDNNNEVLELIFNLYEIIDMIKDKKIDKLDGIKKFLIDFEKLLEYIKKLDKDSPVMKELDIFLVEKQKIIDEYIRNENLNHKIIKELTSILYQTETIYKKISNNNLNNNSNNNFILQNDDFDKVIRDFSIPEIDKLYEKLYESIDKNDVKKITLYRGRLIRALKGKRNLINSKYEEVKCLDEINNLLSLNNPDLMSQIKEILSSEENIKFNYYLDDYVYDFYKFREKFEKLYVENQVKKKTLYKNALSVELNEHSRVLNERYEREFLDKKGNLSSIITVLPKAVGLSIRKMANTINELKEAKTNRKKIAKLFQTFKDSGKIAVTPVIYLGKFVTSNWYSIYMLYKGYSGYKNIISAQNDIQIQQNTVAKPGLKNISGGVGEINNDEQNKIKPNLEINPDVNEESIVNPDELPQLQPDIETNPDVVVLPDFNTRPYVKPEISPQPKPESQPEVEVEPQVNSSESSQTVDFSFFIPRPVLPILGVHNPDFYRQYNNEAIRHNLELFNYLRKNYDVFNENIVKDWTNENIIEPAGEWVDENIVEPVENFTDWISTLGR